MVELKGGIRGEMSDFKGEIRDDMADLKDEPTGEMGKMESRLRADLNRQAWVTISVIATLMVSFVGLTGYFVRTLV